MFTQNSLCRRFKFSWCRFSSCPGKKIEERLSYTFSFLRPFLQKPYNTFYLPTTKQWSQHFFFGGENAHAPSESELRFRAPQASMTPLQKLSSHYLEVMPIRPSGFLFSFLLLLIVCSACRLPYLALLLQEHLLYVRHMSRRRLRIALYTTTLSDEILSTTTSCLPFSGLHVSHY